MKIETSKPDSQSQVANQDPTTTQTPNASADFFFSIILQAAGLIPQIDKSDTHDASRDNDPTQQTTDSTNSDNNPLFQQINFMSAAMDNSKVIQQDAANNATTQSQIPTAQTSQPSAQQTKIQPSISETNLTQDQINQLIQKNQIKKESSSQTVDSSKTDFSANAEDIPSSQEISSSFPKMTVENPKPISDTDLSQIKQVMNINSNTSDTEESDENVSEKFNQISTTDQIVKNNQITSNPVMASPKLDAFKNSSNNNGKEIKSKLNTNQIDNSQSTFDTSNSDNNSITDMNSIPKVDLTHSLASTQLTAQTASLKEQVSHQIMPQSKYTDALVQLGGFINSQTINLANNNSQNIPNDFGNNTPTPFNNVSASVEQQPQYEAKVDLAPPSIDAMMNEIYNAKIRIYPPELGHVMAKLKVDKNNAELSITTENERVKAIVEQHLPQLRENFQNSNINLTQIQVQTSSTDTRDKNLNSQRESNAFLTQDNRDNVDKTAQVASEKAVSKASNSIVDTYA